MERTQQLRYDPVAQWQWRSRPSQLKASQVPLTELEIPGFPEPSLCNLGCGLVPEPQGLSLLGSVP